MKKIRRILAYHNIIMWFHKCNYDMKLYDIEMENNTVFLVNRCACGKTDITRVHRESSAYTIHNVEENIYNVNRQVFLKLVHDVGDSLSQKDSIGFNLDKWIKENL